VRHRHDNVLHPSYRPSAPLTRDELISLAIVALVVTGFGALLIWAFVAEDVRRDLAQILANQSPLLNSMSK
jgi:hypothetical protein